MHHFSRFNIFKEGFQANPITRANIHNALRNSDASSIAESGPQTSYLPDIDPTREQVSSQESLIRGTTSDIPTLTLDTPVPDNEIIDLEAQQSYRSIPRSIASCFTGRHNTEQPHAPDFQEMRDWLECLCEEERERIDPTPEYILPAADRVPLEPAMDTEVLKSIEAGSGPRPADDELEDLVAKLRQRPRSSPLRFVPGGESDIEEYEELLEVLQDWNLSVETSLDESNVRDELALVLDERMWLIGKILHGSENSECLDEQSCRLMNILRAYRPEIADFEDQRPYSVMVAMIANHRVAKPGLDADVWDAILKALFMEVMLQLPQDMLHTMHLFEMRLEAARSNKDEWKALNRKDFEEFKKRATWTGKRLIDDIKAARRNLRLVVLKQQQELATTQATLKWHSTVRPVSKVTLETLERNREATDAELQRVMREQLDALEAEMEVVRSLNKYMRILNRDSMIRQEKMEGGDVSPSRRKSITEKRKNDPATAGVISTIYRDICLIDEASGKALQKMNVIETALQPWYDAVANQYCEYAEWLHTLDDAPAPDLEELQESECGETWELEDEDDRAAEE